MINENDLIITTFVSKKENYSNYRSNKEYGVSVFHIPTRTRISVDNDSNVFKNKWEALRLLAQHLEVNK